MQLRSGKDTTYSKEFYIHNCADDNSKGIINFRMCSSATTLRILQDLIDKIKKKKEYNGMIHWHETPTDLTKYINTSINRKY